jgi:hypothetical protein
MNCFEYVVKTNAGKAFIKSVLESEMLPGDIVCYVLHGYEPCFCIVKDSNRVMMVHEGREKFVFTTALQRAGYVFHGGLRVG